MIVNHVHFTVDPATRDEFLDAVRDLVEASNDEDGVLEYRAAVDVRDENTVRFLERYEDEAAVDAHESSEHFQSFAARLPDFLAGEPGGTQFEATDATDIEF